MRLNDNKDIDVDLKKENLSFSLVKSQQQRAKKGPWLILLSRGCVPHTSYHPSASAKSLCETLKTGHQCVSFHREFRLCSVLSTELFFHLYFNIIKRGAEAITLTPINHLKENLQHDLFQVLYKLDMLEYLLKESERSPGGGQYRPSAQ